METRALLVLAVATSLAACDERDDASNVTVTRTARACSTPADVPVRIEGGRFAMGQTEVYPDEGPVRQISVDGFWMDPHEVTNRQFAAFVRATGHVTVAEKPVDPAVFGVPAVQIPPDLLKPGSAVFTPPPRPSNNYLDWWTYVPGASWRKPYGPGGPEAVPNEPVVHLAFEDMAAYADWAKGRLPTEAEWEYAARADAPTSVEQPSEANSWQGIFPMINEEKDGFAGIAPVGCYRPNGWGLYDMIGNVWEMTGDYYAPGHDPESRAANPTGPAREAAFDPANPTTLSRVVKGGSYLCAPNYCRRYRPAARQARDVGLGASNVGFRLAYDERRWGDGTKGAPTRPASRR